MPSCSTRTNATTQDEANSRFYCNAANTPYLPPFPRITNPKLNPLHSNQPINQWPRHDAGLTPQTRHSAHAQLLSQIHTSRRHPPKHCHRRQQLHAFILGVFLSILFPRCKEQPTSLVYLCAVSGMTKVGGRNFNSLISTS